MGTRSLTHLKDDRDKTLVTIYRQMDGYPTGHGKELKKIAGTMKLTNGFSGGQALPDVANGMGCAAAYIVGQLKGEEIGSIYLEPPDTSNAGEEFVYTLRPQSRPPETRADHADLPGLHLRVDIPDSDGRVVATVYEGPLADFDPAAAEKKADHAA